MTTFDTGKHHTLQGRGLRTHSWENAVGVLSFLTSSHGRTKDRIKKHRGRRGRGEREKDTLIKALKTQKSRKGET